MPSVTIDASVLAAPATNAEKELVHQYVETLLDWKRLLEEPLVDIYMSEFAAEVLVEDGLYPLRPALESLFKQCGIIEYDVNTVARLAESFLLVKPSFEETFKLSDVLATEITMEPDLLSTVTSKNIASELARCIILTAILRKYCRSKVDDHTLIIRSSAEEASVVYVKALIHDLEHHRDDIESIYEPPAYLKGSVLVCKTFQELVKKIDENAIWREADNDIKMALAIKIALYKLCLERGLEPQIDNFRIFTFGQHFFASAKACSQSNPDSLIGRIIRAMVETIDNTSLADTHALRMGKGGNEPQQKRGQDKAWRRDIDYEYHLHYWECDDGSVEFASVVTHNDFSIPEL
jgi:hypothetical protein